MIKPAERTERVKYAIRDIVLEAKKAEAAGIEILYLNIGDPNEYDFRTPSHIIDAIYEALKDNKNSYAPSLGIPEALEAVKRESERKQIKNVHDIFLSMGASEAIEIAFTALLEPEQNVLGPVPTYPLYTSIIGKLDCEYRAYYLDEENNWEPDVEDIRQKIDENTRAIILINPNNPTGSLYSTEVLKEIVNIALERDLLIMSDEIYDKLILDGKRHVSIGSLTGETPILTFNGLSKSYLAPGIRVGWCIASGPPADMSEYIEAMHRLLRARLCSTHPMQYAIQPALEGPQTHLPETIAKLTKRRDIIVNRLNEIDGISCVKPTGAFYAFPRIHFDMPDREFVKRLIWETGVLTVPGSGFGQKDGTRHFRIVFLPNEMIMEKAITKIERFVAGLVAKK